MLNEHGVLSEHRYIALFFVLFGLIFIRYCYYGFEYFYQLDDYIQYHNYLAYSGGVGELIKNLGLLASRPLAGLCDLTLWSRLYENMIVAVAIISAMYAASAIMLHKVFSSRFGTGMLFFVVYALLPLGFEGAYWVSASSRIIVGLFFASGALLCFDSWCKTGSRLQLVLFAVLQFVSFCFYEQVLLFSGAVTFVIMLCEVKNKPRRWLWGFLMFAGAALYLVVTKLAPAGVYGDRTALFLPWQEGWLSSAEGAARQMADVFVFCNASTLFHGLFRGFQIIFTTPNILYVLGIVLLSAAFFLVSRTLRRSEIRFWAEFLAGAFLAAAPLLIFAVIKSPWFGARNALTSFCGVALMLDAVFDLIFGRSKGGAMAQAVISSVLVLLCCVASVSELYCYRETTLADTEISNAAAKAFEGQSFDPGDELWLLNVDASYVEDANFYYHEHGYGASSSDWALTGAVRAISGRGELPMMKPISQYRTEPGIEKERISAAKPYFYKDGELLSVTLKPMGQLMWSILDEDGNVLGNLRHSENNNLELLLS